MAQLNAWNNARRILCVRLDALGDVLMTTPAIRALKETVPGRRITLLTSPAGAEAAALIPEVDDVLVYDAPWMKATRPRSSSKAEWAMAERLRQGRFDAAVVFTVYSQNPLPAAFLCYLADIPLRLAHCHENPYQLLTHWITDPEPTRTIRHEVRRQLDLVAALGCYTEETRLSLRFSAAAERRVLRSLQELHQKPARPWLVMHPGASAPSRRYPAEGFAEAARRLTSQTGAFVVFTGSAAETELIEQIRQMMQGPSTSLAGVLDLEELAALLAHAPLLIANNTGPVHIAAAVGTPVVDLYALTNPQHTPWQVPSRVLYQDVPCKYCYKSICPEGHQNCLRLVTPDQIVAAACELLEECVAGAQSAKPLLQGLRRLSLGHPTAPDTEKAACTLSESMPPSTTRPPLL
jgi:lipopolysaccharide heptosyltransferase II